MGPCVEGPGGRSSPAAASAPAALAPGLGWMLPMRGVTNRIQENLAGLRARIEAARLRGPHAAARCDLLVVSKSVPTWMFGPLAAAGVEAVGENRIQSAAARRPEAPPSWTWHGIGHLQRNKAKLAVETFDVFHALDSLRLGEHLERILAKEGRRWPVYLQVNTADDPAKGGVAPEKVPEALAGLAALPHLEMVGFMTMGRLGAAKGDQRSTFRTLRAVRDEAARPGSRHASAVGLSMGMTDDFEIAVEEGATVVRVGRAVFEGIPMIEAEAHRLDVLETDDDRLSRETQREHREPR